MHKVFFVSSSAVYNAVNGDEWNFFPCVMEICVECTCTRMKLFLVCLTRHMTMMMLTRMWTIRLYVGIKAVK